MKYVANGIYSSFIPLVRVMRKIEKIISQEMDQTGGSEVQMPLVMPAALWESSGRLNSIGSEILKFEDRNKKPRSIFTRGYGSSYLRYPFMIYQFQTKFRDATRPRSGLIRVREFIMKDAYSFHTAENDLGVNIVSALITGLQCKV